MPRACSPGMISCGPRLPRASLCSGRQCTTTLASGGRVPSLRYFRAHSFLYRYCCSIMGSAYGLQARVRSIIKRWRGSESDVLGFRCPTYGVSFFLFFFFAIPLTFASGYRTLCSSSNVITVPSDKLTCAHCLEQYDGLTTMHASTFLVTITITYLYSTVNNRKFIPACHVLAASAVLCREA